MGAPRRSGNINIALRCLAYCSSRPISVLPGGVACYFGPRDEPSGAKCSSAYMRSGQYNADPSLPPRTRSHQASRRRVPPRRPLITASPSWASRNTKTAGRRRYAGGRSSAVRTASPSAAHSSAIGRSSPRRPGAIALWPRRLPYSIGFPSPGSWRCSSPSTPAQLAGRFTMAERLAHRMRWQRPVRIAGAGVLRLGTFGGMKRTTGAQIVKAVLLMLGTILIPAPCSRSSTSTGPTCPGQAGRQQRLVGSAFLASGLGHGGQMTSKITCPARHRAGVSTPACRTSWCACMVLTGLWLRSLYTRRLHRRHLFTADARPVSALHGAQPRRFSDCIE